METLTEIWKDIEGYEGIYQVSDLGRVRAVHNMRVMKQYLSREGYLYLWLRKDGERKICRVHQLVAKAFVPGYFEGAIINHKDENKAHNRADNLEWCTSSYNTTYNDAQLKGREKATTRKANDKHRYMIGRFLNRLRKAARLTLDEAGAKVSISGNTVARIESGIQSVSFDTIEALANIYGYTFTLSKILRTPKETCQGCNHVEQEYEDGSIDCATFGKVKPEWGDHCEFRNTINY